MSLQLPEYQLFLDAIAPLALPISPSELHGEMCGYLCAGNASKGEAYLRALMPTKDDEAKRAAVLTLFDVYAISQQQIGELDFSFQLMMPADDELLMCRAQAFSEWCQGFLHGLTMAGVEYAQIQDDEVQEALEHVTGFSELDYESLEVNEDDEASLMEISEYTRMAVLRIYADIKEHGVGGEHEKKAH